MRPVSDDVGLVLDNPFNDFPFLELHRFGDRSGEVDVVLIGGLFPLDELHLRRVSHVAPHVFIII